MPPTIPQNDNSKGFFGNFLAGIERAIESVGRNILNLSTPVPNHKYKARIYRSAALSLTTNSTIKIPFDTIDYDPNSNASTSTGLYTAPVDGYYLVTGHLGLNASNTGRLIVMIFVNGVEAARGDDQTESASFIGGNAIDVLYLKAGDTVGLYAYASGAFGVDVIKTNTWLTIHYLSSTVAVPFTPGSGISSFLTEVDRQNDTTNSVLGNVRIETGWGVMIPGVTNVAQESVTFKTPFTSIPIVINTFGGDHASSTVYGSGGANILNAFAEALSISTSGFVSRVVSSPLANWAAGNAVFYQWVAIGY